MQKALEHLTLYRHTFHIHAVLLLTPLDQRTIPLSLRTLPSTEGRCSQAHSPRDVNIQSQFYVFLLPLVFVFQSARLTPQQIPSSGISCRVAIMAGVGEPPLGASACAKSMRQQTGCLWVYQALGPTSTWCHCSAFKQKRFIEEKMRKALKKKTYTKQTFIDFNKSLIGDR